MECADNNSSLTIDQLHTLSVVFLGTSCASFVGASSIVVAACVAKKVRSQEVLPLFHLSLADMLVSAAAIISCSIFLAYSNIDISEYTALPYVCSVTVGCVNIFCFSTFILTLAYAIEVYRRLHNRFEGALEVDEAFPLCHRLLYAGAWLIPLLFGAGCIIIGDIIILGPPDEQLVTNSSIYLGDICLPIFHDINDSCVNYITHNQSSIIYVGKYLILIPLSLVSIGLAITYIMVIRKFKQATWSRGILGPQQRNEELSIRRRATCYIAVFCLCWIPSLVLGAVTLTVDFRPQHYFYLYVIQASTTTLQGFLNSIVYGWSRTGFKQEVITQSTSDPVPYVDLFDDTSTLIHSSVEY